MTTTQTITYLNSLPAHTQVTLSGYQTETLDATIDKFETLARREAARHGQNPNTWDARPNFDGSAVVIF